MLLLSVQVLTDHELFSNLRYHGKHVLLRAIKSYLSQNLGFLGNLYNFTNMSFQVVAIAVVVAIFLVVKVLSRTDTPKIKGLPEVPGIPIFGNLLQFGSEHAKVAEQLSKRWGPVFQVRFGNKVGGFDAHRTTKTDKETENRLRKHIRLSPSSLDHKSISPDLPTKIAYLPHSSFKLTRIHHRNLALGRIM